MLRECIFRDEVGSDAFNFGSIIHNTIHHI